MTASVTADGTRGECEHRDGDFVTSGTVTAISVKVGDKVKKGQVLAKVDATAAKASLDAAEANLTAAQDALDRAEDAGSRHHRPPRTQVDRRPSSPSTRRRRRSTARCSRRRWPAR